MMARISSYDDAAEHHGSRRGALMRSNFSRAAGAAVLLITVGARLIAQAPAAQPPTPAPGAGQAPATAQPPVVQNGRQNPGMPVMPPFPLPPDDVKAIAEYIHSVVATARPQGAPPPGAEVALNIVVGDAKAGAAYFASKCASCHSATGDLQ